MKQIKKMMALVIAMAMIVSAMSMMAFAADDLDINSPISVTGLSDTDTIKYYHIIEWKNGDWNWTDAYSSLSADYLATIKSGSITEEIANAIGAITAEETGEGTVTDGVWSQDVTAAGMYMVAITTQDAGVIYNPVFVSANFSPDTGNNNTIPVSGEEVAGYGSTAMAKKTTIEVNKETDGTDGTEGQTGTDLEGEEYTNPAFTADNGEVVSFTITTTIPLYADNYTNPVFRVKDTLQGMELASVPVVVKPTTVDYTITSDGETASAVGDTNFIVEFDSDDIKAMTTAQEVEITYTAKITDAAALNVNQEDNTVTVEYSNGPEDEEGAGRLKDQTNHFTFSIDAAVNGEENESSTDVIKVGVKADGTPLESEVTYTYTGESHPALNGAVFKLYKDDNGSRGELYTNDVFDGTVTTGNDGRMQIKGLDAGKYWLVEESAPAGYIKWQYDIPVEIDAVIEEYEVTEEVDGIEVTYKTNRLVSYTVTVNGGTTTYNMTNSHVQVSKAERDPDSSDGLIQDIKGVELPSTGGMGTTLFYVIGAILVVGAGVILITRRRMDA